MMPNSKGKCHSGKEQECRNCINYYTQPDRFTCDLPDIFAEFDSILDTETLREFMMHSNIDIQSKINVARRLNTLDVLHKYPDIESYLINTCNVEQSNLTQFDPKNSTRKEIIDKLEQSGIIMQNNQKQPINQ